MSIQEFSRYAALLAALRGANSFAQTSMDGTNKTQPKKAPKQASGVPEAHTDNGARAALNAAAGANSVQRATR
jgi:hypothetical protein